MKPFQPRITLQPKNQLIPPYFPGGIFQGFHIWPPLIPFPFTCVQFITDQYTFKWTNSATKMQTSHALLFLFTEVRHITWHSPSFFLQPITKAELFVSLCVIVFSNYEYMAHNDCHKNITETVRRQEVDILSLNYGMHLDKTLKL